MIQVTRNELETLAPRPKGGAAAKVWDDYVAVLVEHGADLCTDADIDVRLEWVHFIAQVAHECQGFTLIWESGAYTAPGILRIFGAGKHTAAVSPAEARAIAALPQPQRTEALFERAYGLGNPSKARELGNTEPGDGWRYRGFGPMQITGKRDHLRYLEGDASPFSAMRAAFREWKRKGCNKWAARDDIERVTRLINGGQNGLAGRRAYLAKAKRIWAHLPDQPQERPAEGEDGWFITPSQVRDCQERLSALGYRPGDADGEAGPLTREAVLSFQAVNGVPTSGVLDRATAQLLLSQVAQQFPISNKRSQLSVDDLRERGSSEISDADAIGVVAKRGGGAAGGYGALDWITGGALTDTVLSTAERAHSTITKLDPTGKVLSALLTPRVLVPAGAVLCAFLAWRFAKHMMARRVARARSGKDLSR